MNQPKQQVEELKTPLYTVRVFYRDGTTPVVFEKVKGKKGPTYRSVHTIPGMLLVYKIQDTNNQSQGICLDFSAPIAPDSTSYAYLGHSQQCEGIITAGAAGEQLSFKGYPAMADGAPGSKPVRDPAYLASPFSLTIIYGE